MRRPRFRNPFTTEAEIAAVVREALESLGWTVYPEACGWDLFAVHRAGLSPVKPGDTMGIECKLDAGTASGLDSLLRQSLPLPFRHAGPRGRQSYDFFAPPHGPHFRAVASARIAGREAFRGLGVATWELATCPVVWRGYEQRYEGWQRLDPYQAEAKLRHPGTRVEPVKPPTPPEIVIDVPAGVPSPQTSSAWKIKAVRLMLRLRDGERLTSADFDEVGVNVSRFRSMKWAVPTGEMDGRRQVLAAGDGYDWSEPPDRRWPEIAEALRAKEPTP